MTKVQEQITRDLLEGWLSGTRAEDMRDPTKAAERVTAALTGIVTTYQLDSERIQVLLQMAFAHTILFATEHGAKTGAEIERQTNPAIKSAGECVKVARQEERRSLRTVLRAVFDAETTRGTNAFYAFNEALKAIE